MDPRARAALPVLSRPVPRARQSRAISLTTRTRVEGFLLRIIVAGGAGMIGSHLCEALLVAGHEVVCVDNLSTGRLENLQSIVRHPAFRFVRQDVSRRLSNLGHADRVYHLASPASPVGYTRLPIETMLANSEGTRRLLELTLACDGRFLFASTSEVYGDPQQHPQREDYRGNVSTIGPRSAYDESKRYGEAMTMAFVRNFNADARIVRIFNTYGPRADLVDGRVIVNFIRQAMRQEPMTIYGDGKQTRSMCFVDDLVEGLIRAMESQKTRGEVVNLGNPEEHTVLEIAEIVRRQTRSNSRFVFTAPAVGDDPRMRCPDIQKARELLAWQPGTSLETGLKLVICEMLAMYNGELSGGVPAAPHRPAGDSASSMGPLAAPGSDS